MQFPDIEQYNKSWREYHRVKTYPLDEILSHVVMSHLQPESRQPPINRKREPRKRHTQRFAGKKVYMDSLRLQTFVKSGVICVQCGLKGQFFVLEQQIHSRRDGHPQDRWHFNLYGLDKAGREILFTKDHTIPP